MASHKSALKAHRSSIKKAKANTQAKSRIKTFIKKLEVVIERRELDSALGALRNTESEIMKGVKKGVLKLNAASRKVSKLTKKIKALEGISPVA